MDNSSVEYITRLVIEAVNSAERKEEMAVPIGVSARHIHLTQEHVEKLFGPGYQLTRKKDLMGGQWAACEQCTLIGLKLRAIENVRILGPVRSASQSSEHKSASSISSWRTTTGNCLFRQNKRPRHAVPS